MHRALQITEWTAKLILAFFPLTPIHVCLIFIFDSRVKLQNLQKWTFTFFKHIEGQVNLLSTCWCGIHVSMNTVLKRLLYQNFQYTGINMHTFCQRIAERKGKNFSCLSASYSNFYLRGLSLQLLRIVLVEKNSNATVLYKSVILLVNPQNFLTVKWALTVWTTTSQSTPLCFGEVDYNWTLSKSLKR
jgi:hypothetical protein